MNNIATQRIKREFKEVIKSEEVSNWFTVIFDLSILLVYSNTVLLFWETVIFRYNIIILFVMYKNVVK